MEEKFGKTLSTYYMVKLEDCFQMHCFIERLEQDSVTGGDLDTLA